MAKAGKGKHRKIKSKAKEAALDEKALEAELERKYIRKHFYGYMGSIFDIVFLLNFAVNLFCFFFYPGLRHQGRVGAVGWVLLFMVGKSIVRFKGTDQEIYGKELFETFFEMLAPAMEILMLDNDSVASEEARNAHASMMCLACYCVAAIGHRVAFPKYKRGPVFCVIYPLVALKYPRFGIFRPRYEALAWFVALSLGFAIGGIIDEIRWRHFLLMNEKELEIEEKSKELAKESHKREMAMEVLLSYNDKSSFFEIRK